MHDRRIVKKILPLLLTFIGICLVPGVNGAELTDLDITRGVESQIIEDPGVTLNSVDVNTINGIVSLTGAVNNILAKDRAVAVAQTVKGVRSVVDRIKVKPTTRTDTEIKDDINHSLLFDPLSESWEIDVTVKDAKATLHGTVDSWTERDLIAKIAKGVRGVTALENKLGVDYKTTRNDFEIQEEINRKLYWDALVDDHLIKVTVNGGKVSLSGTVGSAAERVQAHRDAWVAGVESVDSSDLEVRLWARDEELRRDKYALRSDKEIEKAVNDAMLYDPRVNMFDVNVKANSGRVTLQGTVDNLQAKRSAAVDARNTVGVWSVRNLIKVKGGKPNDAEIAKNIRDSLLMDPYVELYEIDVKVNDGVATLTGTVDSYFEKAQADLVAAGVHGVTDIRNRLKVEHDEILTYNPYIDRWYTYDYDWYIYPDYIPIQSDWEIRQEIKDELFWSPFVDSEDITVSVDNGVATLTGKVDSWMEYSAAVENALEGGAVMVDNELELKNRTE